jgi:hypothetical protein
VIDGGGQPEHPRRPKLPEPADEDLGHDGFDRRVDFYRRTMPTPFALFPRMNLLPASTPAYTPFLLRLLLALGAGLAICALL